MHIVLVRYRQQSTICSLIDRHYCCKYANVVSSELFFVSSLSSFCTDLLGRDCKQCDLLDPKIRSIDDFSNLY